jgi:4-amino-4-deoxy-L-arabinose transferase-like glycosyltransferase
VPAEREGRRKVEASIVLGSLVVFLILVFRRALAHPFPFYDDVAYLATAKEIHALGGPIALIQKLYGAEFTEANRHPLYLALLSLVAREGNDPAYHIRAQILTAALGAVALIVFWWVVRRHFGPKAALFSIAILAISETLIENSARETCEPLLIAIWALATSAILVGKERPFAWVIAGALSGLAFLTKGTGIMLAICFFFAVVIEDRARAFKRWSFYAFYAAFAITASPLLVRNVRMYGSPLYTVNSRWLWIDRLPDFAEVYAPQAEALLPTGPKVYFQQATLGSVAERIGGGIVETIFHFGDSMSLVAPFPPGPVHFVLAALGIAAAGVAIGLLYRRPRSWLRTFLLVEAAWFYAFFAFYDAVSASSRYLIPMTMMLVAILGEAIAARGLRPNVLRLLSAGAAVAAILTLVLPIAPMPPGFEETERWIADHVAPKEAYAIDARTKLQPAWLLDGARQVIVSSSFFDAPVSAAMLLDHFRKNGVRWVLLDASSRSSGGALGDDPKDNRYFFYDQVPLEADGSLPLTGWPTGLEIAYADPETPRRWIILEVDRSARAH